LHGWRRIRFVKLLSYVSLIVKFHFQEADAEEMKAQKKEMEDIVQPIIAKLYQGAGGPPPGGEEGEDEEFKDEL